MTPKEYKEMMAHLTRKGIQKPFTPASAIERPKKVLEIEAFQDFNERNPKAGGGRIGFSYGSIPEALKKLIEDGDTNFESMPALKNEIEKITGKRPGGSFQINKYPLLEKFTFEKFKTKKKYKPEEYIVEDQKKLNKKIEKLNKKYKLKNKGINVTQQVTATGKPILEIQANNQVYGQVGRQAPPSIDGFNDIESELKKITKTDTFKNYDKSAAMKKGGEKAAAKMINPNKKPVFDYVLKNPNVKKVDIVAEALDLKKSDVTKTLQSLYADMYKRLGDQGAVYFKQFDSKDIVSVADSIKDMDVDLKDRVFQLVTNAYKGDKNITPVLNKLKDFYALQKKIKKTEYGKFFAANLDHPVPLTLIRQLDEGADPMNLIKIKPMPEYLNQRAFKSQFDKVLGQAYATKNKEALEAIVNLQSYLPKEFGGITPDGKIKDYGAKPFSLKTNLSQTDFPEIYKRVFDFIKNPELQDTFEQSKVSFKKLLSQEKQIMKQAEGFKNLLGTLNIPKSEAGFIERELLKDIARVGGKGIRTVSKYFGIPDAIFGLTDFLNEKSKGKSNKEARGIMLNNLTFGAYSNPQNKAYIQGLQKTAESMGIDSSAFNSAYQLNILDKDFEKYYTKGTEQIKNLKELGLNDQAKNAQMNLDRYADEQNKKYMMLQNDISDRIIGGSPLTMVQGRGKVTQEQFAKPFFDMQDVALEKLKREKQSVFPTIQSKVDTAEGSMGTRFYNVLDQIGQGVKNIVTGRIVPFGPERFRPQASQRQLLADELRNLSARDLQRRNLGRGLTYGQPLTNADLENLQYQQPGVFFAGGGIAKIAGVASGPPPE